MSFRDFIKENRDAIDEIIRKGGCRGSINDNDRKDWIMNDEGLYMWAKSAGVKV